MAITRLLYRFSLLAAVLAIFAFPPLPHHAMAAEDEPETAADANDDGPGMDANDDEDRQANNNGDDDEGDRKSQPPVRKFMGDRPHGAHPNKLNKSADAPPPPSNGNWWHPRPGTKWEIQYVGKIYTNAKVDAFNLDLFDVDPATIKAFHERGVKVICYFSAGSSEAWRPDIRRFPKTVLGRKMTGWKDENWLDIRQLDVLRPIMEDRIKQAKEKGCDAVDPDNVEGYDNKSGFGLNPADQIAYNKMIADLAHSNGLAVGLKNDVDQVDELLPYFDFQVNEQCFEYHSCEQLIPFIEANKPVFNIEYNLPADKFCPQANRMNFDSLKKTLDLDATTKACR